MQDRKSYTLKKSWYFNFWKNRVWAEGSSSCQAVRPAQPGRFTEALGKDEDRTPCSCHSASLKTDSSGGPWTRQSGKGIVKLLRVPLPWRHEGELAKGRWASEEGRPIPLETSRIGQAENPFECLRVTGDTERKGSVLASHGWEVRPLQFRHVESTWQKTRW